MAANILYGPSPSQSDLAPIHMPPHRARSSSDLVTQHQHQSGYLPASPLSPSTAVPGSITPGARQRYLQLFNERANGRFYLSGFEAALILKESGMRDRDLVQIYQQTDIDRDGRLNKDEFIRAMFLIELRSGWQGPALEREPQQQQPQQPHQQYQLSPPHSPNISPTHHSAPKAQAQVQVQPVQPPLPTRRPPFPPPALQLKVSSEGTLCAACSSGLIQDDQIHCCSTCNNSATYCIQCYASARRCRHNVQPALLKHDTESPGRPEGTRCDFCTAKLDKGDFAWCCKTCGDFSLCGACWREPSKRCKHAVLGRVQVCPVGGTVGGRRFTIAGIKATKLAEGISALLG